MSYGLGLQSPRLPCRVAKGISLLQASVLWSLFHGLTLIGMMLVITEFF